MDTDATLTELRRQHALTMECIAVFKRLAGRQPRRRGRPSEVACRTEAQSVCRAAKPIPQEAIKRQAGRGEGGVR
jgi:hypothetical protein